ncbi:MAG TPA: hypothetical protein EYP16_03590, partial [Candidatus Atribacteria bacterium]|nr:hypothetical protein [Candidatus Atribacteria bacterium]
MNIELEVLEKDLVVILPSEAKAISTTVYGGGFKRNLKYVVFHEVSRDFNGNPIDECKSVLENLNLDLEKSAVFLTATKVSEKYVLTQGENENLKCTVV